MRARVAKSPRLVAVVLAVLGLSESAIAQNEYGERFARAAVHEAAGRYGEAVAELTPLQSKYPDDYSLVLKLAWLRYQAGAYAAAADDYRRAAEISQGAQEARLGLAWSLLQLGLTGEASKLFLSILEVSPELASAQRGLALAEGHEQIGPAANVSARADFAWVAYQDHPVRNSAWSLTGGFGGLAREVIAWDVTYRFARFEGHGASGSSGNMDGPTWDQHEFYGLLGYARPRYGVHAHFAYLRDEAEFGDNLFAIGLSGRLNRRGRLWVESSLSFYPDERIFRFSPAWRLPIVGGLYIEPSGALQVTDAGVVLGNGALELGVESERGSLRIGGKGGPEQQPLYLFLPLMLNLRDELRWGLWAGGSIRFARTAELRLTYSLDRLELFSSSTAVESNRHVIAASLRGSF